jgi:aminoglycoside 6'-N-acetyltransferase
MIQLRPATLDDIPMLEHWDKQPHVIAANPLDDGDWQEDLSRNEPWEECLIAEIDGRPVGVLYIIDPEKEPTRYWGKDCVPGFRAIDIWIGEATDLGKGYGTEMMNLALQRCFDDPGVEAVLIDPLSSNKEAIRFYEKLGFEFVEERIFGKGDHCAVYRIDRDTYNDNQKATSP